MRWRWPKAPGVRWVSLDAPTVSTSTESVDTPSIDPTSNTYAMDAMVGLTEGSLNPMYITWATVKGTVLSKGFTNVTAMYNSPLGPNGTFGYGGDKIKGSFGGFEAQVTPGTTISKVELVLHAYMPKYVAKVIKYQVYIGGVRAVEVRPNTSIFSANIGSANAGPVYIDVTGTRSWQWADLTNSLEVAIDQSGIGSTSSIYYDAIGLRVTSVGGSGEVVVSDGDTTTLAAVVATAQQNVYNQVIRASDLWNTSAKIQGKEVGVAVIDSGVQRTKDLDKRLRANVNFNKTFHNSVDRYGHGTFVAGIIAGNGSQSLKKYIGVAPRADIYNIRVSDDVGMANESDVITALQWINDNKANTNIRVVNLSLNSSLAQSYHTSPLDAACEILWFNGIVVVVAAGNNGDQVIYPPANDPFVITVGATNDMGTLNTSDDAVTGFSAHGVTEDGFTKPDLVAPGKNIIGLLPDQNKLTISMMHPENRVDQHYFRMSGTSVSAPMVSGAVTLLLQDEPGLTPDQVKYRLTATANQGWAGYDPFSSGAGYLDVYAAVNGTSTESANTGLTVSSLLTTGEEPVNSSVAWNSRLVEQRLVEFCLLELSLLEQRFLEFSFVEQ